MKLGWQMVTTVLALGALAGCAAPTLPLPPPEASVGPPNELGIVHVDGSGAEAGSLCFCLNKDSGGGVITTADERGHFACDLEAEVGDLVAAWYEIGRDKSLEYEDEVPPPPE